MPDIFIYYTPPQYFLSIPVIMYLQAGWKTKFLSYQVFTSWMENNVDPDQLADKSAELDQYCF